MTDSQLALDLSPLVEPIYSREATIAERWAAFRSANPWVVPYIAGLLDDWSEHGGKRVGVKSAVEWARWNYTRSTVGSEWKWDNTLTSRLARDLVAEYPHLKSVIETRCLRAA